MMTIWYLIFYHLLNFSVQTENDPAAIQVCTINIRYDNPKDGVNQWANRKKNVASFITRYQFDVIGMQEALNHQVAFLDSMLPEYSYIGTGRDDGNIKGEYSPIFYHRDRMKLLDSQQFWLSDTPSDPGSMGWDAVCPRIVTLAKFEDRLNNRQFWMLNTHFDHVGDTARTNSCSMIMKLSETKKAPIILTGDFNANESSEVYHSLLQNFENTRIMANDTKGPPYTFHGFKGFASRRNIIDHIFVSRPSVFDVISHEINTDYTDELYLSDHFTVIAKMKWHE